MSAPTVDLLDDIGSDVSVVGDPSRFRSALDYDAPFLIEKLLKEKVVDTAVDGAVLFGELKRFLVLAQLDRTVAWSMYSVRVDAVWHQFVLFTREYLDFCTSHLGGYVHHTPTIAVSTAKATSGVALTPTTFRDFADRYRRAFGEPLPDLWINAKNVTPTSRIINDDTTSSVVHDDDGMVSLVRDDQSIVLSVNDLAADAIDFIAATSVFFVRELPGDLTADEKVGLVAALVDRGVLRLAC